MKLSVLPPLMILCSEFLLQNPPLTTALPVAPLTTHFEQTVTAVRHPSNVIFHPSTRSCVLRKSLNEPLKLGPCNQSDAWSYTPQKILMVRGTYFCLQAVDSGKPARLGVVCSSDSEWEVTSSAKPHLSTKRADGSLLCLDVDPGNTLITNPCLCLSNQSCEADNQWFEITLQNKY
ncbi:glycosyl hydrolase 5 family protein-like [Phoenix dactylifera]|uniref:Glycosyl hydrolase 5 family protein-like n=1 Tax=Phoenix dactylifera TaxID=42345 RepID=A0A8B7CWA0_PHODC|nr:glycosyl hydrolase 5 family protein-like [Phoenix dactylifera]